MNKQYRLTSLAWEENKARCGSLAKEYYPDAQICSVEGCTRLGHRHHKDYTLPLDITWLCPSHHMQLHAKERKEKWEKEYIEWEKKQKKIVCKSCGQTSIFLLNLNEQGDCPLCAWYKPFAGWYLHMIDGLIKVKVCGWGRLDQMAMLSEMERALWKNKRDYEKEMGKADRDWGDYLVTGLWIAGVGVIVLSLLFG